MQTYIFVFVINLDHVVKISLLISVKKKAILNVLLFNFEHENIQVEVHFLYAS